MKLLISGSTGFIGEHLVKKLKNLGHNVETISRQTVDSLGSETLSNFYKEKHFDGIIHLASLFIVQHKEDEIPNLIESNIILGTRLLEFAAKSKVKWFLNTGTFWQHYQNKDYSPVNLYAASKMAFEDITRYYMEAQSLNVVSLKLNDTYGPGDKRKKLFNIWKDAIETGSVLDMSPGEQLMDVVFIDDVVNAYLSLISCLESNPGKVQNKTFAISSCNLMSLKDLSKIFEKVAEKKLNINWGGRSYREREVMQPWQNFELVPGWEPKVKFEEGIRLFLNAQ